MIENLSERKRMVIVVLFAVAMAWAESAVVVDLRTMIDRIDPYQAHPLPVTGALAALGRIEVGREAATLVMLWGVGMLAGRSRRSRWAYALLAFGLWDVFYYVWLKLMAGWPSSLLSWDILFLMPLPWWGPVLAPVAISLVLIAGSALVIALEGTRSQVRAGRLSGVMAWLGTLLALYTFMSDTLAAAASGPDAVRELLPVAYDWQLFGIALALLAAPCLELAARWARTSILSSLHRTT